MYNQGFGGPGGYGRPGMGPGGPGFGGRPGMGPGMGGPGFGGRPGMGPGMGGPGFGGPGMGGPGMGGPHGGFGGPQGGFPQQQQYNNTDDDGEWEYVTDDEGDYIEDENGNIMTPQEAEQRGLCTRSDGTVDRGIGKNLLIGGAILGGLWILNKQLKKKRRVKKANPDNVPYKWVKWTGSAPVNTVSYRVANGKTFIIARGKVEDGVHCGYADPQKGKLYTSYGGKEVVCKEFEVLTCPMNRLTWIKCTNPANIGNNAVVGGYENDGTVLYVVKCMRDQTAYFGKTYKKAYCAYYGFDDREYKINDFEYLAWN
jgi:Protein of unknown function (DUF3421).